MPSSLKSCVAGFALACAAAIAPAQPILIELEGTVMSAEDDLGIFPAVVVGDAVSVRVVFDTSLPRGTTVTVQTGGTQGVSEETLPVVGEGVLELFGAPPVLDGIDADGIVAVSLALPSTEPLDAATIAAADLDGSSARVSYATLVSVEPLIIDESVFRIDIASVRSEVLDIPTAFCRPVDFDLSDTVDGDDRSQLIDALVVALDGGEQVPGLDVDGDGEITTSDLAEAVFLLNRCSNEGPGGQPLVDALDVTGDQLINVLDLVLFLEFFENGDVRGDIDGDGELNFFDLIVFLDGFDTAVLF